MYLSLVIQTNVYTGRNSANADKLWTKFRFNVMGEFSFLLLTEVSADSAELNNEQMLYVFV